MTHGPENCNELPFPGVWMGPVYRGRLTSASEVFDPTHTYASTYVSFGICLGLGMGATPLPMKPTGVGRIELYIRRSFRTLSRPPFRRGPATRRRQGRSLRAARWTVDPSGLARPIRISREPRHTLNSSCRSLPQTLHRTDCNSRPKIVDPSLRLGSPIQGLGSQCPPEPRPTPARGPKGSCGTARNVSRGRGSYLRAGLHTLRARRTIRRRPPKLSRPRCWKRIPRMMSRDSRLRSNTRSACCRCRAREASAG